MLKKLLTLLTKYAVLTKEIVKLDKKLADLQNAREDIDSSLRGLRDQLRDEARDFNPSNTGVVFVERSDPFSKLKLQAVNTLTIILQKSDDLVSSELQRYTKKGGVLHMASWTRAEKDTKLQIAAEKLKAAAKAAAEKKAQADAKKAEKEAKKIAKKNAKLQEKLAKAGVTKKPAAKKASAKKPTVQKASTKKPSAEATPEKAESKPETTTEAVNTVAQQVATEPVPNAPEATA